MTTELENTLARELHEVADGVRVPPMPALPSVEDRGSPARLWRPLLVAAVVTLIVGVAAVVRSQHDDDSVQPAPPGPTRATDPAAPTVTAIPATTPTVPFIVDRRLYVDGAQVPGEWWGLQSHAGVWVATQFDGSWWWGGPGVDAQRIDGQFDQPPVLSPGGGYVAYVDVSSGRASVNGFTTEPSGEGFGPTPLDDLPPTEDGIPIRVRAVTDDGDVIVQGTRTSLLWRTRSGDQQAVADLSRTAPDQVVLQGTPAGLVVVDGSDGAVDATDTEPYLATTSRDGSLTPGVTLPTYDALEISPGGSWLVRSPAGTLGGDAPAIDSLRVRPVAGGDETMLDAPDGWGFVAFSWVWEDDETILAALVSQRRVEPVETGLVRCRVDLGTCQELPAPTGRRSPAGPTTAEQALGLVVDAVASGDRAALADPGVIGDAEWDQLVGFAAGGAGSVASCRDNGSGTKDCGIDFGATRDTVYYAILEPADNAYGWRVTYVGIGGA